MLYMVEMFFLYEVSFDKLFNDSAYENMKRISRVQKKNQIFPTEMDVYETELCSFK